MKKLTLAAVAVCFALGGTAARAQDAGALLDLLVKKRLITDQEAEEVRTELVKESAETSAGKWKLSTPITEIELYGDVRLRYNYDGGGPKAGAQRRRPVWASQGQTIGKSVQGSVTAFAWACVERLWMIGSSAFAWRPIRTPAQQT
jgi:hypothetical protein